MERVRWKQQRRGRGSQKLRVGNRQRRGSLVRRGSGGVSILDGNVDVCVYSRQLYMHGSIFCRCDYLSKMRGET